MEITIAQALEIKSALKEFDNKPVNSTLSYWLGRLEDKIDPIVNRYEKIRCDLIINKYGVKVEGSDNYQVPSDKLQAFGNELAELVANKETIEIRLKLSLFAGVEVSKDFFRKLGSVIEDFV